jgi:transcriptional regulator with XRE-family HTH domain
VPQTKERRPRPSPALLKQQLLAREVRRLRRRAGLSLRALASTTGFSPSFVSQVENAQVSPSISSMEAIAGALGVTLGEFFAATAASGDARLVVRAAERPTMPTSWWRAEVEALTLPRTAAGLEVVLVTLGAGGRSGRQAYRHPREEFAFVLQGSVSLAIGPESHVLRPGDAVTVPAGQPRLWTNKRRGRSRLLLVLSPVVRPTAN